MSSVLNTPLPDMSDTEFEEFYSGLSAAEKDEWQRALADAPTVGPNPGPQTAAYNSLADVTGYGGAEVLDSVIKTPTGNKKMGDVEIGDVICDAFGSNSEVIGIRDRGLMPVFKVSFSDGTHTLCSSDHLWLAWSRDRPVKRAGRVYHGIDGSRVIPTWQIREKMDERVPKKFRIQLCQPAMGYSNRFKIDPYVLGAFLGDGHLPQGDGLHNGSWKNPRIVGHIDDCQVMEEVAKGIPDGFVWKPIRGRENLVQGTLDADTETYDRFMWMGLLGKRSWEKFLPPAVASAPIAWRWSCLQGLLDTDGSAEESRCAYYTTVSPMLRDGVADLARSLGCFVTVTEKIPTYTHKGEKRTGRLAYTLRIKSATPEKLFRLKRKKEIASRLQHQSLAKEITDIEELAPEEQRCIQVSCPSGLYLTKDFTVTHNSAGGGKSALIAMLALQQHQRTVIFRSDSKQIRALVDDLIQFAGTAIGLNRNAGVFRVGEDRVVEWGGIGDPASEQAWRGRAHDLFCVDEATEVSEKKIRFLLTWNRTVLKNQRVRALFTFNPPGGVDDEGGGGGRWVVDYFAPWLDERHPNPAAVGELRYFYRNAEGEEVEADGPAEVPIHVRGETHMVTPRSRTFIPARVTDNPYLTGTSYEQQLWALEEPTRSQMLFGDFRSGIMDSAWQILPTKWVDEAMDRWTPEGRKGEMSALGVDVARGGRDHTVMAARHGYWFDELKRFAGKDTPDGHMVAGLVVQTVRDKAQINIDSIGVGASPFDILKAAGNDVVGIKGSLAQKNSGLPQMEKHQEFFNLRSMLWWILRKILDPANGYSVSLPKDKKLRAELISVHFQMKSGKWAAETKEELKRRLRYSPDDADALANSVYNIFDLEESERILAASTVRDPSSLWASKGLQHQKFHMKQSDTNNAAGWMGS